MYMSIENIHSKWFFKMFETVISVLKEIEGVLLLFV